MGRKINANEALRAFIRAGQPYPPWDNRPKLPERLRWVWEAFQKLGTCRPVGMGIGAIPWTAINDWVVANDVAHRVWFERLIQALDNEYLALKLKERDGD